MFTCIHSIRLRCRVFWRDLIVLDVFGLELLSGWASPAQSSTLVPAARLSLPLNPPPLSAEPGMSPLSAAQSQAAVSPPCPETSNRPLSSVCTHARARVCVIGQTAPIRSIQQPLFAFAWRHEHLPDCLTWQSVCECYCLHSSIKGS